MLVFSVKCDSLEWQADNLLEIFYKEKSTKYTIVYKIYIFSNKKKKPLECK
jgi:hypothetical protein